MTYTLYMNREKQSGEFRRDTKEQENRLIELYPRYTDQIWDGFGGAVTDSAAYIFSLMSGTEKKRLLDACFGPEGLQYRIVRLSIDSCDFSLEPYEASADGNPQHFDMTRPLKYILPMLEEIRKIRPDISLMLSPWSPPAAFKTNGKRQEGGKCRKECCSAWAEYICQYIREFTDRGFHVGRISLQNEPHAVQTWDSCLWDAEEERDFLVSHMKPALLRHGFDDVQVYIWDHNKERILERAVSVLDGQGRAAADGIAFHWYSGDHFDALRKVHELFPEKKLLLSENCIEYSKYHAANTVETDGLLINEITGDLESGTNAFLDWNLVLDERGGPNYVGNYCHAPFLYDTGTRELKKQSLYDVLWHFAHFLLPGSRRCLSSSFSAQIAKTAFLRPDGSAVLILHNRGGAQQFFVRVKGEIAEVGMPVNSLAAILIDNVI